MTVKEKNLKKLDVLFRIVQYFLIGKNGPVALDLVIVVKNPDGGIVILEKMIVLVNPLNKKSVTILNVQAMGFGLSGQFAQNHAVVATNIGTDGAQAELIPIALELGPKVKNVR